MFWLVVDLPLWKIWIRQLGWWQSQFGGKIKAMFQTTNQFFKCVESHRKARNLMFKDMHSSSLLYLHAVLWMAHEPIFISPFHWDQARAVMARNSKWDDHFDPRWLDESLIFLHLDWWLNHFLWITWWWNCWWRYVIDALLETSVAWRKLESAIPLKISFSPRKKASLILIFPIPSSHKLDVYLWAQLGL